jgi:TPR repeat protein
MPFPPVLRVAIAAALISPAIAVIPQAKAQSGAPTIDYQTYQEELKKAQALSGIPPYVNDADATHQFLKSPEYRRRLASLSAEIRRSTGQFCSDITIYGDTPEEKVKSGIEMVGYHNESVALCSFASAVMAGNVEAIGWYGVLIERGKAVPADPAQAAEVFKLSADAGGPTNAAALVPPPADVTHLRVRLTECEGDQCGPNGGGGAVWLLNGQDGYGGWKYGAFTNLSVQKFDNDEVVILRSDPIGSYSGGLTAVYKGERRGDRIDGYVTWTWPGHFNGQDTASSTWFADVSPVPPRDEEIANAKRIEAGIQSPPPQWSVNTLLDLLGIMYALAADDDAETKPKTCFGGCLYGNRAEQIHQSMQPH